MNDRFSNKNISKKTVTKYGHEFLNEFLLFLKFIRVFMIAQFSDKLLCVLVQTRRKIAHQMHAESATDWLLLLCRLFRQPCLLLFKNCFLRHENMNYYFQITSLRILPLRKGYLSLINRYIFNRYIPYSLDQYTGVLLS